MICTRLICSSFITFEVNTKQLLAQLVPLLGHTTPPSPWELPCGFTVPFLRGVWVEASWNVMTHTQNPDFSVRRNGRVHLNRRGRQFSRLLEAEVCASAVVMLDTPCSEVVWRVLATYSIRQFPLHFPSRASPCAITFQLESTIRRQPMSKLRTQSNTVLRAGSFSPAIADNRWWISDGLTSSLQKKHAVRVCPWQPPSILRLLSRGWSLVMRQ